MKKILIANRGEIAARIVKTCEKLQIEPVIVYSQADKDLPYVKDANIAHEIGEPPVVKSYLNSERILEIALHEKVDAIHPGYGFLSENADFVRKVENANIKFIGPSADVVEEMGDKVKARKTMQDAGVPVVPGSDGPLSDVEEAVQLAADIGYPVMIKASAGGGGIGMQRCEDEKALRTAFISSQNRAKAYFGNDEMFMERFISNSRHIEVQIFGDEQGNVVHLFERDCSIQRRHQKVIEETPSPFLSEEVRRQICEAAVQAGKHVNYTNAGTVEFIVDENEDFYFLEMNTRLQVEHPITEMITGLDLVEWQINVAQSKPLPYLQGELTKSGHSIEYRIYAEDPHTFLPSPGKIEKFQYPTIEGVRVDTGFSSQTQVTPFYDPMIAKVIIYAEDRDKALERSRRFFEEWTLGGIKHNGPLFDQVLNDESFQKGEYTTNYLNEMITKVEN
ncbi:acetyl-CoA carboxylase biotin carboxylase subunit [Pseudalkalibacillus salsuginis]|uniref:acetyl-CoA carboxylase biotin carboxylase subunit n=1 Tax=Pseudalkalibacillus salsuginis TaxID=2910972 RepID=UPI001F283DCA|nr:acetyl-CoA carboxylase biotin carboxylase subunit [Pseudalkalibacillus salsuginis]MCF6410456.1 acetyl-CoA carboxylase biotin carboxylase subunit [Pseudalkalibacillus salsuginis]